MSGTIEGDLEGVYAIEMKKYETIEELLDAPEGEQYEFKQARNRFGFQELVKYCCALANCGGGKIIFGITDSRPRKAVGSAAFEQPERTKNGLMEKLRIRVDFSIYKYNNKRVLAFEVAGRPIGLPVQADGIAWWRKGDSLVPMPSEVMRSIFAETGHDFSSDICPEATIKELSIIRKYIYTAISGQACYRKSGRFPNRCNA